MRNGRFMHLVFTGSSITMLGCASAAAAPPLSGAPGVSAVAAAAVSAPDNASGDPYDYFGGLEHDATIPSPRDFLGHAIGERFTRHADVTAYLAADVSATKL